ncbi:MAG: DUF402 domain-containing protein [Haloarculaceae archaeon]
MTVRIRGIYTTALTHLLDEVVQASGPIERRFETTFPEAPAAATVETTRDRQGVTVAGDPDAVASVTGALEGVATDVLTWDDSLPQDGIFAGEVVEELGRGALVDVGPHEGFLPYSATSRRIETGDVLRVQVADPRAPWLDGRPVLDTDVRVRGDLVTLRRGGPDAAGPSGSTDGTTTTGGPTLGDLVAADSPAGWAPEWHRADEGVSLDARASAVEQAGERAAAIDATLEEAAPPAAVAPGPYWTGLATTHSWFGREARFTLDDRRRAVTQTMAGHHRIKAGSNDASAAVDFVEAVCGGPGGEGAGEETAGDSGGSEDASGDSGGGVTSSGHTGGGDEAGGGGGEVEDASGGDGDDGADFPFAAVSRQFGPAEGDSLRIGHGKPDGRLVVLGSGDVTECRADGTLVLEREMTPGGTYDALGVERQAGDVATTKFKEGRWWYPTVYRGEDGALRGTYVNVCTPVEVFPETVRYVDLHVDVVRHAEGTVERVDDDELDAAEAAGDLSPGLAEKARAVARAVERAL